MAEEGDAQEGELDAEPSLGSLADQLDYLFRHVHGRDRGEYSYREVAAGIEAAGGPTISPTYLMYLRKGERTNPSLQHLKALAAFFGVPAAYFLDKETTERVVQELDLLVALRDAGVRTLALRAADLSPDGVAALTLMAEEVRRAEHEQGAGKATRRGPGRRQSRPNQTQRPGRKKDRLRAGRWTRVGGLATVCDRVGRASSEPPSGALSLTAHVRDQVPLSLRSDAMSVARREATIQALGTPSPRPETERLDYLFRHIHSRDGGEYSYREVADKIKEAGGPVMSPTRLKYLREGQRENMRLQESGSGRVFPRALTAYFVDAYCAAKFAVRGFSESLRHELAMANSPVRVSVVHPGGVLTNIVRNSRTGVGVTDNARRSQSIERFDAIAKTTPPAAAQRIILGIEKISRGF